MQIPGTFTWLITGGAGFIGSHLARELVRQNQCVIVFDNLSGGTLSNLTSLTDKISFVQGDIRNFESLQAVCKGVDFILHHAALASVPESVAKPLETFQTNVQGTAHVLEAARQNKVKRVIFACSSAIYGNKNTPPYAETAARDCLSPYALSKQAGLELCQLYTREYGLETIPLIYFNVFGPHQNPNAPYAAVIAKFMQQAQQNQPIRIDWDGLQSRDFVSVHDVVQANLLAALKAAPGEAYNVAQGKTYTLLELADTIERVSGRQLKRIFRPKRDGDVKLSSADISKIRALGFVPSYTLEEGLSEMWKRASGEPK